MKHREPPHPVSYKPNPALDDSVRLKKALGELETAERFADATRLDGLRDATERLFARVTFYARKFSVERTSLGKHLERATNAVRKVVVQPSRDLPIDDCLAAWSQPEAADLWEKWWNPAIRKANTAAYEASKAVMVFLAGTGHGPYVRNVHELVTKCTEFLAHFEVLALDSSRMKAAELGSAITLRSYSSVLRHFSKLAIGLPYLAMQVNVAAVRELARLHPDASIGCFVGIDGDLVAAWAQQRSSWDRKIGGHNEATEQWLRRRTPEAGFRAYAYTLDGPEDVSPGGKKTKVFSKRVRGYNLVTLTDLVTGIPLVWIMRDASKTHEPRTIGELLELLYQLWPDIPLKAIVADKLWDEHNAHEFCAVHYGVALVTPRKHSNWRAGGKDWGKTAKSETEHKSLLRISGSGVAYCREHGQQLTFLGSEWPSREGLAPGEPHQKAAIEEHRKKFRSRWTGEGQCGCGRLSAAASVSWSALPFYPHTPYGRPDLFAMRVALLAARNQSESAFSSLEIGFKQALASGVRTRLLANDKVEGLISLAFTTRALILLADQRRWARRSKLAA
jgi:hypothetical protein